MRAFAHGRRGVLESRIEPLGLAQVHGREKTRPFARRLRDRGAAHVQPEPGPRAGTSMAAARRCVTGFDGEPDDTLLREAGHRFLTPTAGVERS